MQASAVQENYMEILQEMGEPHIDPWEGQIYTLKDAYKPREPLKFIVSGLFTLPSLSIVYGAPGSMKSLLLADMAVCVAAGSSWLSRRVIESPVLWLDFDNGSRRTHERISALAMYRNLPEDTPVHYVSMPSPWFNASNQKDIDEMAKRINSIGANLVCIDNLGLISGGADENSSAMIQIMGNLRYLSERTGAAIILIHHQRKGQQNGRAGDLLRGHTSIEAALDLALHVSREDQDSPVIIKSTKTRDVDVTPFSAVFCYEHKEGTDELYEAHFEKNEIEDISSDRAIEAVILNVCSETPNMTQKQAIEKVKPCLQAGVNRIRGVYNKLRDSGTLPNGNRV